MQLERSDYGHWKWIVAQRMRSVDYYCERWFKSRNCFRSLCFLCLSWDLHRAWIAAVCSSGVDPFTGSCHGLHCLGAAVSSARTLRGSGLVVVHRSEATIRLLTTMVMNDFQSVSICLLNPMVDASSDEGSPFLYDVDYRAEPHRVARSTGP